MASDSDTPISVLRVIQSIDPALPVGFQVSIPPEGGVIGRLVSSEICLPGNTVSRRHAELQVGSPWTLTLLTTSNAVFVNGEAVKSSCPLPHGTTFQIGGVVCALMADEGTTPVLTPLEESVLLAVRRDGEAASVFSEGQLLAIGTREALVLAALAEQAGSPVHRWDLIELLGDSVNLDKVMSNLRKSLREALDSGALSRDAFQQALGVTSLEPAELVMELVRTRRGHGYVLALPKRRVRVEVV